jgi:hypothetical protein
MCVWRSWCKCHGGCIGRPGVIPIPSMYQYKNGRCPRRPPRRPGPSASPRQTSGDKASGGRTEPALRTRTARPTPHRLPVTKQRLNTPPARPRHPARIPFCATAAALCLRLRLRLRASRACPPAVCMEAFAAQHQGDVCMEAVGVDTAAQQGPRPRTAHRRSRSDVPSGYYFGGEGHQLPPPKVEAGWGGHLHGGGGDDDLFNAYLNLEGLDGLNSSDDRRQYYDGDSRGSSVRTNGADSSENDSEECAAAGPPVAHHVRSLSMDSSLIGKLNFSAGAAAANGGVIPGPNRFSLEFGSGEFTPVEMNKIMADEKLAEMALADPKRAKR